jgi:hypothetical protein
MNPISAVRRTPLATHDLCDFAQWAIPRLGLPFQKGVAESFCTTLPADALAALGRTVGQRPEEPIQVTFDPDCYDQCRDAGVELLSPGSPLFEWLITRLTREGHLQHAVVKNEPQGVYQLSGRLFSAYRVEGGSVRLGGCILEDRRFVQFSYRLRTDGPHSRDERIHQVLDPTQQYAAAELVQQLRLNDVAPLCAPPRVNPRDYVRMVAAAQRLGQAQRETLLRGKAASLTNGQSDDPVDVQLLNMTFIWCKFAEGKLCFEIGEETLELPFAGWASTLEPPPFTCPQTGRQSYHLSATDDGFLAAAEEIARCDRTGRRMLRRELVACAVTGKLLSEEFVRTCPVTGEAVERERLVKCTTCGQEVSPHARVDDQCTCCSQLERVNQKDERLATILGNYPELKRWRRWQMAESETAFVLSAEGMVHRLLLVLAKSPLKPMRAAQANRLRGNWTVLDSEAAAKILGDSRCA